MEIISCIKRVHRGKRIRISRAYNIEGERMIKGNSKKCRYCGKEVYYNLYCNSSCRNLYLKSLTSNKKFKHPEKLIKEALDRPINPYYLQFKKVEYIPKTQDSIAESLRFLNKDMDIGETRCLQIKNNKENPTNYIRKIITRNNLQIGVVERLVNESIFVYLFKHPKV